MEASERDFRGGVFNFIPRMVNYYWFIKKRNFF